VTFQRAINDEYHGSSHAAEEAPGELKSCVRRKDTIGGEQRRPGVYL
jgi:hypothetical protein